MYRLSVKPKVLVAITISLFVCFSHFALFLFSAQISKTDMVPVKKQIDDECSPFLLLQNSTLRRRILLVCFLWYMIWPFSKYR